METTNEATSATNSFSKFSKNTNNKPLIRNQIIHPIHQTTTSTATLNHQKSSGGSSESSYETETSTSPPSSSSVFSSSSNSNSNSGPSVTLTTTTTSLDDEKHADENAGGEKETYCICNRLAVGDEQASEDDDLMIECDACNDWLHGKCVQVNQRQAADIEVYVCPRCVTDTLRTKYKARKNDHRHDFTDENAEKRPTQAGTRTFVRKLLEREDFPDAVENNGPVVKLNEGHSLTMQLLDSQGFDRPYLIENKIGLNVKVPESDEMDLTKIEDIVGSGILLDVIDVERQETAPMKISALNAYFRQPVQERQKIYNLLSFEISNTKLNPEICVPKIVEDISWTSNGVWPITPTTSEPSSTTTTTGQEIKTTTVDLDRDQQRFVKPEVQKYCLISAANSYTDFHIDFGGSSVWYHIVKGEKIFYLMEPSAHNLAIYEEWNSMKNHSEVFLADLIRKRSSNTSSSGSSSSSSSSSDIKCYRFHVKQGSTILLPTGWIHAVYTPYDSLVFGGNFLQQYNIPLQIKVFDIELRLKTPEKFLFPAFVTLQWYAAKHYTQQCKELNQARQLMNARLFTGLRHMQHTLKKWINSKDYFQLHDHELPRRLNLDKLVKIMGKELGKQELLLRSFNVQIPSLKSSASSSSLNSLSSLSSSTHINLSKKDHHKVVEKLVIRNTAITGMFIDGNNDLDSPTESDTLGSTTTPTNKAKPTTPSTSASVPNKKPKEVLNYGNIGGLFGIKLEDEDPQTKEENEVEEETVNKQKEPPLIMKISKGQVTTAPAPNASSEITSTLVGGAESLKLKLKIVKQNQQQDNTVVLAKKTKSEMTIDELVTMSEKEQLYKQKQSKANNQDEEMIKELKQSYADDEYFYPSLNDKKSSKKRKTPNDSKKETKPDEEENNGKRKKKLKPHAAHYLQPPDNDKDSPTEKKKKDKNSTESESAKNKDKEFRIEDESDKDFEDDDMDADDEDFKLKCKNNLKLSKKMQKKLVKQQQKDESNQEGGVEVAQSESSLRRKEKREKKEAEKAANKAEKKANKTTSKKGYSTTKQRLSKLLKLNRVVNI